MDILSFVAAIIGHVAWPVTAIVFGVILRQPLLALLPALTKIKYKNFEVAFGRELERVEAKLDKAAPKQLDIKEKHPALPESAALPQTHAELVDRIASLSPRAAILESWWNVEAVLGAYFSSKGIREPVSGQTVLAYLKADAKFPRELLSAYQELRLLRNRAAHSGDELTKEQAQEFDELAARLTRAIVDAV